MTKPLSLSTPINVDGKAALLCTDELRRPCCGEVRTWETMVLLDANGTHPQWDQFQRHYYTEDEAKAGHVALTYQSLKGTLPLKGPYTYEEEDE